MFAGLSLASAAERLPMAPARPPEAEAGAEGLAGAFLALLTAMNEQVPAAATGEELRLLAVGGGEGEAAGDGVDLLEERLTGAGLPLSAGLADAGKALSRQREAPAAAVGAALLALVAELAPAHRDLAASEAGTALPAEGAVERGLRGDNEGRAREMRPFGSEVVWKRFAGLGLASDGKPGGQARMPAPPAVAAADLRSSGFPRSSQGGEGFLATTARAVAAAPPELVHAIALPGVHRFFHRLSTAAAKEFREISTGNPQPPAGVFPRVAAASSEAGRVAVPPPGAPDLPLAQGNAGDSPADSSRGRQGPAADGRGNAGGSSRPVIPAAAVAFHSLASPPAAAEVGGSPPQPSSPPPPAPPAPPGEPATAERAEQVQSLIERAALQRTGEGLRLQLLLQDDRLGRVSLRLSERSGMIDAMLRTDSPRTARVLAEALPALLESSLSARAAAAESGFSPGAELRDGRPQQESRRRQPHGRLPRRSSSSSGTAFRLLLKT